MFSKQAIINMTKTFNTIGKITKENAQLVLDATGLDQSNPNTPRLALALFREFESLTIKASSDKGNTFEIKDQLKELGFKFEGHIGPGGYWYRKLSDTDVEKLPEFNYRLE